MISSDCKNNKLYKYVCLSECMSEPIITKATLKKEKRISTDYAYTHLYRLSKQNRIKKVLKGNYTVHTDPYIIATNLYTPSYLSFWGASYFKGYTEQIVNTLQIATTVVKRPIIFENYTFEFTKLSARTFFGFTKMAYGDSFIFVATDEKLIIDAILHEDKMGNFDEIEKCLMAANLDCEIMVSYLRRIQNKSLNKRVGFLLETYKKLDISQEIVYKDTNTILLSKFQKGLYTNSKWGVKHDIKD